MSFWAEGEEDKGQRTADGKDELRVLRSYTRLVKRLRTHLESASFTASLISSNFCSESGMPGHIKVSLY